MNTIVENEETEVETEELEELEAKADGEEGTEEETEVEIVLDGEEEGSRPDSNNLGIRKRINKLNAKVSNAQDGQATANAELENERQKNKLLELALEQKNAKAAPSGPPDPLDFDDGARDAKYVEALHGYNRQFFQSEMAKHTESQPVPASKDLEVKQTQHYEAAEKLGIKDYDDVEDQAIGILGMDTVNQLIGAEPNSPQILYYLGKNPNTAQEIADLLRSSPIKGVMKLGALSARLKVAPKAKRNQAPNPDDELESTTSSHSKYKGSRGATFE